MKADLFETDFSKATVITMFLLPQINMKLRPKILDMKPGTRVVSNTFTMEDWEADETQTVGADCTNWCTALFWIVPAKVEGTWKMPQGELALKQTFQMISGTLGTTQVTGRLRGSRHHVHRRRHDVHGPRERQLDSGQRQRSGRLHGDKSQIGRRGQSLIANC